MWWDRQNLNQSRTDREGRRWNFRVWNDFVNGKMVERIFYWDDQRDVTGVVFFNPGVHVSRLQKVIQQLVASEELRDKYRRDLRFPLERHYRDYGAFPEESSLG